MKKILIFLFLALILLTTPVAAAPDRLVDDADLLSMSEEQQIRTQLDDVSWQYDVDIVIVTVNSTDGKSPQAYADDFFDYSGYSANGVLLLVDMGGRNWWISTTGSCISTFSGNRIDRLGDRVAAKLSNGDYSEACREFIDGCESYLSGAGDTAESGGVQTLLVCAIIGFVIALIVVLVMKSQLKSVRQQNAGVYEKPGSFRLTRAYELFLYRNVTRTQRQQSTGTHISASGRSHGGGGGRF